mmetsp:Transcript_18571/g.59975  ORF Transcript_18571/g.59975 Transcript_18571/m.59975 type:complete len:94 (-) Transcript_18571:1378-1659(-)
MTFYREGLHSFFRHNRWLVHLHRPPRDVVPRKAPRPRPPTTRRPTRRVAAMDLLLTTFLLAIAVTQSRVAILAGSALVGARVFSATTLSFLLT